MLKAAVLARHPLPPPNPDSGRRRMPSTSLGAMALTLEATLETSAALALAAPIAEPTQTGVKTVQETTTNDGTIGLLLSGYASRFGETDLAGEIMTREAFHGIK